MPIKKYRSGLLVIVFILFGIYCFVLGDSGILERMKLVKAREEIEKNISILQRDNNTLQKQYSIVSNNKTNSNFYKREASKQGFIAEGEKYIFFKKQENQETSKPKVKTKEDKYKVELSHLRILWAVASIMIILLYFGKRSGEKKEI